MTLGYTPPGWPGEVRPPGAEDWEATATAYLLDCCPPDFRAYTLLRRHPVVLARFAVEFVEGQHRSAQSGLAGIRVSLAHRVEVDVIDEATQVWLEQAARLARTRRAVGLVEDALRGRTFVARM